MPAVIEFQSLLGEPAYRQRVQPVLLFQYPGGKRADRILPVYRDPCLQHNRAAIDGLGHEVNAGTVLFTSGLEYPLVCIEAGKLRQQRGMNVQHTSLVAIYEAGGQYPHEARQYDKPWLKAFNAFLQGTVESSPVRVPGMVNYHRGDAGLCRPLQAAGCRPVTDTGTNFHRQGVVGNSIDYGLQGAAPSGNQDNDGEWRVCRIHGG